MHRAQKISPPIPVAFIPTLRPKVEKPKIDKIETPKQKKPIRTVSRSTPQKITPNPPNTQPKIARRTSPRKPNPPVVEERTLPKGIRWPDEEAKKPRPQVTKNKTIVHRSLPSLQELQSPLDWSRPKLDPTVNENAISLNSKDPHYISYLASIKQSIELVWEYPLAALNQGIQGTLVIEFTIAASGSLSGARLINSSGFSVLDEEALRTVRSAAPFHPIPYRIEKRPLSVVASFEYFDNRLR